jgi:hypothetical protein
VKYIIHTVKASTKVDSRNNPNFLFFEQYITKVNSASPKICVSVRGINLEFFLQSAEIRDST